LSANLADIKKQKPGQPGFFISDNKTGVSSGNVPFTQVNGTLPELTPVFV
jgi:hypothetical protein